DGGAPASSLTSTLHTRWSTRQARSPSPVLLAEGVEGLGDSRSDRRVKGLECFRFQATRHPDVAFGRCISHEHRMPWHLFVQDEFDVHDRLPGYPGRVL